MIFNTNMNVTGVIQKIRKHTNDDNKTMYFVEISYIATSKKENDSFITDDWQNVSLLADKSLNSFCERNLNTEDKTKLNFVLNDLYFTPALYKNKPQLKTSGYLTSITKSLY